MSIQLTGGPNISTSFVGSSRSAISSGLVGALNAAGWNGNAALLTSATTPQGLSMTVALVDPGSGTLHVQMNVGPASITGRLETGTRTYRVIANKYQFFCFVENEFSALRGFVACGVPYLESIIAGSITQEAWAMINASADDSGDGPTFREKTYGFTDSFFTSTRTDLVYVNNNSSTSGGADLRLLLEQGCDRNPGDHNQISWFGGEFFKIPPRITFGIINEGQIGRIRGQLWDAMLVMKEYPGDTTVTDSNGRTWWNVMHNNGTMHVSLWLLVP